MHNPKTRLYTSTHNPPVTIYVDVAAIDMGSAKKSAGLFSAIFSKEDSLRGLDPMVIAGHSPLRKVMADMGLAKMGGNVRNAAPFYKVDVPVIPIDSDVRKATAAASGRIYGIEVVEVEDHPDSSRDVEVLVGDGIEHVIVGDVHLQISDLGARTVAQRFLSRLATLQEGLPEDAVNRLLAIIDDALPEEGGTPESDLGPFYSTAGLIRRWGVSRQALNKRVHRRTLLALPVDDGSLVYPAFQFRDPSIPGPTEVLPGIKEVADALTAAGEVPMSVAAWLTATDPRLGDRSGVDLLRDGEDAETVIRLAKSDARRWMR